jgi:vacuolar fusion protein MON1
MQHGEALCPLCLPAYNPAAFLHAYLQFLPTRPLDATEASADDQEMPATMSHMYLALIAPSSDCFHAMSRARQQLEASLLSSGVLQRLLQCGTPAGIGIEDLPSAAGTRFGASCA